MLQVGKVTKLYVTAGVTKTPVESAIAGRVLWIYSKLCWIR